MNKYTVVCFFVIIVSVSLIGCGGSGQVAKSNLSQDEKNKIISESTQFLQNESRKVIVDEFNKLGWELLKINVETSSPQNIMISPTSISIALSMVFIGTDGETKTEMERALGWDKFEMQTLNSVNSALNNVLNYTDDSVTFKLGNSLWGDKSVIWEQDFLQTIQKTYRAKCETLDFKDPNTVKVVNEWVKEATSGKIPSIVDQFKDDTVAMLINAIYFKGIWADKFNPNITQEHEFTLVNGEKTTCQMMRRTSSYSYTETENCKVIALPYQNKRYQMIVFLPAKELDIYSFMKTLTYETLNRWINEMPHEEVRLMLPRFKFEFSTSLVDSLKQLGINKAFSLQADLSKMGRTKLLPLYLSDAIHKTYIEVNEEGTEAAAVTGMEVGAASDPGEPKEFVADKPFLFLIRDTQTELIHFTGIVLNPNNP